MRRTVRRQGRGAAFQVCFATHPARGEKLPFCPACAGAAGGTSDLPLRGWSGCDALTSGALLLPPGRSTPGCPVDGGPLRATTPGTTRLPNAAAAIWAPEEYSAAAAEGDLCAPSWSREKREGSKSGVDGGFGGVLGSKGGGGTPKLPSFSLSLSRGRRLPLSSTNWGLRASG